MKRFGIVYGMSWALAVVISVIPSPAAAFENAELVVGFQRAKSKQAEKSQRPAHTRMYEIRDLDYSADRHSYLVVRPTLSGSGNAIGITIAPTDAVLRAHLGLKKGQYGVVVTRVIPKSPAEQAGVRKHDIVLTARGTGITTANDLDSVIRKTGNRKPLELQLMRGGKTLTVQIRPTPVKESPRWTNELIHLSVTMSSKYMIGVTTKGADAELIAQLVLPPSTGLVITSVTPKGPAEAAGLQKYDVILKAGDKYVKSSDDLSNAIDEAGGKAISIEFVRAGRKQTCTVKPVKRPQNVRLIQPYNLQMLNLKTLSDVSVWGHQPPIAWKLDTVQSVESQVNSLSKQVGALEASLARLKQTLAKLKAEQKKPESKKSK